MNNKNPYLNVYLGALKKPWADYCARLGKKPGAALKEAIEAQLSKEKRPDEIVARIINENPDRGKKERFEILLTPTEKEAIRQRAEIEGCSMRAWIVDACRAGLTREPQFNMHEIKLLGESNYQLLAIGRNLNQIAKRINIGEQNSVSIRSIDRLRDVISTHVEKVSGVIRANLERWSLT